VLEPTVKTVRLLVVEDEPALRDMLVETLACPGRDVAAVGDGAAALARLSGEEFDVVVLDLRLPKLDGIGVLRGMRAGNYDAEVVIITAHADANTAIEALKLKAFDYVQKPFALGELVQIVERALEHRRLRRENRVLRRAVAQHEKEPLIRGESGAIERLRQVLKRSAASHSHVVVLGESGSGKELAARTIHGMSPRSELPFLAINCAALPDELLESELFGHEKGAFTGATARRHGLLELAHEGTLFLDEVAEMTVAMQAKLLRALDRGEIRRLGGDRVLHVDVRVIAATNQNIDQRIASGAFRHDLYYRLSVVVIEIPPLRQRIEDIPLLVEHFARQLAPPGQVALKFTAEAMALLKRYAWPGNVRELRNLVERITVLAVDAEIGATEVALHLSARGAGIERELPSLAEVERRHILKVLAHTDGNRARAASILGVDPKTLYNKLKVYERLGS
jgi:DNA-binding NtrC family response regulator